MTKQTFKLHSNGNFSGYLKKFSPIEKNLLIEIDGDKFIAKTHTPDKAVVKISSTSLAEIFDKVESATNVKIGLFSVDNVVQTFKHIGEKDVSFDIVSEPVSEEEVATEIKVYNKSLRFTFPGASPSLFKYINSQLATQIMDTAEAQFSFRIDKDTLGKIASLCSIDSDNDMLSVTGKNGSPVVISGKTFEQELEGVMADEDFSISFYKSHFSYVDKEDSDIFVLPNKIIFKSTETETSIAIGKVE